MSTAHKCDRCGALYVYEKGVATIERISVANGEEDTFDTWSEIDLCRACAVKMLEVLSPALDDAPESA